MLVKETAARQLLSNLGYDVEELPSAKLARSLNDLQNLLKEANPLTEVDDLNLRDEILEANTRGEQVALFSGEEAVATEPRLFTEEADLVDETEVSPTALSNTPPAPKAKKTPAKKKAKKESKARVIPQLFGHSVVRVAHWMGSVGFKKEDGGKALAHFGHDVNPSTLRTYLTDGKNPKYAKPAELTDEQKTELLSFLAPQATESTTTESVQS
jgi:hypothetical protein